MITVHVRPNGLAYHLKRECGMLAGDQYERLHYKAFEIAEPRTDGIVVKRERYE